jgi:hypothetical protein
VLCVVWMMGREMMIDTTICWLRLATSSQAAIYHTKSAIGRHQYMKQKSCSAISTLRTSLVTNPIIAQDHVHLPLNTPIPLLCPSETTANPNSTPRRNGKNLAVSPLDKLTSHSSPSLTLQLFTLLERKYF